MSIFILFFLPRIFLSEKNGSLQFLNSNLAKYLHLNLTRRPIEQRRTEKLNELAIQIFQIFFKILKKRFSKKKFGDFIPRKFGYFPRKTF